jgi:hypothetical protein
MISRFNQGLFHHNRSMDVFIDVLKVRYVGPNYTKLKVIWWNRGQSGTPYSMRIQETIKVKIGEYKNWSGGQG